MEIFLAAGATVTKAVDFCRNAFDQHNVAPGWVWNLVAFAFGIAISHLSDLNIAVGLQHGKILTGLAIGAAASGFHEVFDFFSAKAGAAEAQAEK